MSKPLTMTVEREAWIREHGAGVTPQSWQPGATMLRDLLAEVDALRAALAAAEANAAENHAAWERGESERVELRKRIAAAEDKLADCDKMHACQCARVEILLKELADERKQLTAALEDERRHADALADKLSILALGRINRTEVTAHFARRNAEKEVGNG